MKINSILFYFTHTCLDRLRKTITPSLSILHTTATIKTKRPTYKTEDAFDQRAQFGSCLSVQTVRQLPYTPTCAPSILSIHTIQKKSL